MPQASPRMETTFYHDDGHPANKQSYEVNKMKRTMTLDFNSGGIRKQSRVHSLLQSPDMNLLKLASPELERMIIQANGMVTTTPTPTQFIYPRDVTEEQEAYARGFVDALNELHNVPLEDSKSEVIKYTTLSNAQSHSVSVIPTTYAPVSTGIQSLSTTTTLPGSVLPGINVIRNGLPDILLKEEPQTVPCLGSSPPMSPINMVTQEKIKLDRKRARNRVAARKCRTRKLERISRLEDRVNALKDQNSDLSTTATSLRDQVCKLKQQIMDHMNSGCQVMVGNNVI